MRKKFGCKEEQLMFRNEQKTGQMMEEIARCSYNPVGNLQAATPKRKGML